jgi:hypothetical protein
MKRFLSLAVFFLFMGGCTTMAPPPPDQQAQYVATLESGNAVLDCGMGCNTKWILMGGEPQAVADYNAQDWAGLAGIVMSVDFQMDITYFYLGRAAEGLGAYSAAMKYYQIAGSLATSNDAAVRCEATGTLCDGFSFPNDLYARMQQVQADIDAQNTAAAAAASAANPVPVIHHHHYKPKPAAQQAPPPPPQWITPPPVTH